MMNATDEKTLDANNAIQQAWLTLGQQTLQQEAQAIDFLAQHLSTGFTDAISILLACQGKVICMGMGKSGHVARKIAATLASTGTPAFFIHPSEAYHGDLGMIEAQDVVLLLSNSGETEEILNILHAVKRQAKAVIAITNHPTSSMAQLSDAHIPLLVEKEACPHNLAPTTSTTVSLALGDALAVALLSSKHFSAEDFALSHPGGSLGRRLLIRVKDIMRSGQDMPYVLPNTPLSEAVITMSEKKCGCLIVVENLNVPKMIGIFTDGDLRRVFENTHIFQNLSNICMQDVLKPNAKSLGEDDMAIYALEIMQRQKIYQLLVINQAQHVVGLITMHDLLSNKIV